jgi:hypothetical protein
MKVGKRRLEGEGRRGEGRVGRRGGWKTVEGEGREEKGVEDMGGRTA